MNYRTVLRDFSPIEWGDFLMRFEINQRSYVLFSPEHGKVSCLELMYFTELDPLQLSVLLGIKVESEPMDEFIFRATCSRDRLIDYLFDVKAGGGSVKPVKTRSETSVSSMPKPRSRCWSSITVAARPVSEPVKRERPSISVGIRAFSLRLIRVENGMHRLICWLQTARWSRRLRFGK